MDGNRDGGTLIACRPGLAWSHLTSSHLTLSRLGLLCLILSRLVLSFLGLYRKERDESVEHDL